MDITPLIPQGRQIIQSYADGRFKVSGATHDGPVIVFTDRTIPWNAGRDFTAIGEDDFSDLLAAADELDVILVGCGKTMKTMPFALRQQLKAKGLAVDFMDTGAACRTYNVLMTEGRRVAVALLPT